MGKKLINKEKVMYKALSKTLDEISDIDFMLEHGNLTGANLELFEHIVEIGDKWHFIWEKNYHE